MPHFQSLQHECSHSMTLHTSITYTAVGEFLDTLLCLKYQDAAVTRCTFHQCYPVNRSYNPLFWMHVASDYSCICNLIDCYSKYLLSRWFLDDCRWCKRAWPIPALCNVQLTAQWHALHYLSAAGAAHPLLLMGSSPILCCLDARSAVVAKWLLLHPTRARQALEALWEKGTSPGVRAQGSQWVCMGLHWLFCQCRQESLYVGLCSLNGG